MQNKLKSLFISLSILWLTACGTSEELDVSQQSIVIDVRTLAEWNSGHLESAVHLPVAEFASSIESVATDKEQQVILYCQSGGRAERMKSLMTELGYSNVINAGGVQSASSLTEIGVVFP